MKRLLLVATVATLALFVFPASVVAQTGGNQGFGVLWAGPTGAPRTLIAFGTINSFGTEVIATSSPGVSTVRWEFPEGTLFVRNTFTSVVELDPEACLRTATLTGTWRITNGTGEFAGATGGGTFSGPNQQVLNLTPDGDCAPPPALFSILDFQFEGNVELANQAAA